MRAAGTTFLNTNQVAKMIGCSWATARDLLEPLNFIIVGNVRRYRKEDIQEVLNLRKNEIKVVKHGQEKKSRASRETQHGKGYLGK